MKQIKILFINSFYSPDIAGGAEIVLREQVEGLAQIGYTCIVLTTTDNKGLSCTIENGIKVYRAEIKNKYWHFQRDEQSIFSKLAWHSKDRYNTAMKSYISEVIEREQPAIVICHNLSGWSISIWDEIKKHKLPIIQVLHDMYFLCTKSTMFNGKESCKQKCMPCQILRNGFAKKTNLVDVAVGVSQFIINKMIDNNYFIKSGKQAIHNQRDIQIAPIKTRISNNNLTFGYIGTLNAAKGVEMLIKAWLDINLDAQLLIAGRGESYYEQHLHNLAQSDNRVQFIGYTKPTSFFDKIDICIVPSLWNDTFPGVAIESCAYNVPVIATNMGGLPEIIKDGVNGFVVEPNKEAIKDRIIYYYNNPDILNNHKENARASVSSFLNFDQMISEYDSLIKETLDK